jgi:Na+-transporting methylmalonyl-CoA/oxaloacetate decarboxylase beta subunit
MDKHAIVNLFHILIVGTLFLYIGIQQTTIPKWLFPGLLGLGVFIVLYHSYKAFNYSQSNKPYWVNLIHVLIVGPLLIYIGVNGAETERRYFEMLLMTSFAVIGYHAYYLLSNL